MEAIVLQDHNFPPNAHQGRIRTNKEWSTVNLALKDFTVRVTRQIFNPSNVHVVIGALPTQQTRAPSRVGPEHIIQVNSKPTQVLACCVNQEVIVRVTGKNKRRDSVYKGTTAHLVR